MISAVPKSQLSTEQAQELTQRLTSFYATSQTAYYLRAEEGAADYSPGVLPYHYDLISRVKSRMSVLELGCGSAHLCPHVLKAGGHYTGVDYGLELLAKNRARYPEGQFFPVGTPLTTNFDLVTSLYTIEHVVDPQSYLETLWEACKPGGFIAIICPDFVDGDGFPPSFFFGRTSRRLREKLRTLAWFDAGWHLLDLIWVAPRWKIRARAAALGTFWINRKPRILNGGAASVDADAVHLPRLKDLVWWLEKKGAAIVATSASIPDSGSTAARHNCYVLAQKP